ncbi:MAG: glutathione peroxidase [Muribaculaceae bacterium]|nr:glutathione peroxidase [Muribaculaceae bacterium]
MNIYDFNVLNNKGEEVSLSQFKGKVLLIVNTATGCGFTPQYKGLEELYRKYKDKGLEILDFPCNQFGHQAPGSDQEINSFCTLNYDTTFPRFKKIDVNGDNAAPLYKWLKKEKGGILGNAIKWNFTKFLVDRNGNVIDRYSPTTSPVKIEDKIKELLAS